MGWVLRYVDVGLHDQFVDYAGQEGPYLRVTGYGYWRGV